MASKRNRRDIILDAARGQVLAVGVRRMTLTDVARQAGVSRMTVYRQFPDVDAMVRELLTREFGDLIAGASQAGEGAPHVRGQLVAATVAAVRALHDNDLLRRVLDVDPELLVPYLVDRLGGSQRTAAEYFADGIARGQADGSVRAGPVPTLAHTLMLTVQSYALSMRPVAEVVPAAELYAELATLLDSYLSPPKE